MLDAMFFMNGQGSYVEIVSEGDIAYRRHSFWKEAIQFSGIDGNAPERFQRPPMESFFFDTMEEGLLPA